VAGFVVEAGAAVQPVRRAIVTIGGGSEPGQSVVTDDRGRFEFVGLEAGRIVLNASKPGYVTTAFGAKGPGRPGTPIALGGGDALADLRIVLARGGVITGTVRDGSGEPAPDVLVTIVRVSPLSGPPLARGAAEPIATDDLGVYRVFGLPPGEYVVAAQNPILRLEAQAPTRAEVDAELRALGQRSVVSISVPAATAPAAGPNRPLAYAPVFHPGTAVADQASVITLAAGTVADGVDIALTPVPASAIDGVVVAPGGQIANVALSLMPHGLALSGMRGVSPTLSDYSEAGRFRFSQVAPGTYTLLARSTTRTVRTTETGTRVLVVADALPAGEVLWGSVTVTLSGDDITLSLPLRPALTMRGRVVFDATTRPPPSNLGQVQLTMVPALNPDEGDRLAAAGFHFNGPPRAGISGTVNADGTFEIRGLTPGRYTLDAIVPGGSASDAWWMQSAMADGKDLLDVPNIIGEADPPPVVVTFSDRRAALWGVLQSQTGLAAADVVVVAFPADRVLWRADSRRARAARPGTDGRFSFADIPPGDYLLAALANLDEEDWRRPAFLEQIAPSGVRVTIGVGERTRQDVRIVR
jgi:hypothetical protein